MKLYELLDYLRDKDNAEKKELFYKECKRITDILGQYFNEFKDMSIFEYVDGGEEEDSIECYPLDCNYDVDGAIDDDSVTFPAKLLFISNDDLNNSKQYFQLNYNYLILR